MLVSGLPFYTQSAGTVGFRTNGFPECWCNPFNHTYTQKMSSIDITDTGARVQPIPNRPVQRRGMPVPAGTPRPTDEQFREFFHLIQSRTMSALASDDAITSGLQRIFTEAPHPPTASIE